MSYTLTRLRLLLRVREEMPALHASFLLLTFIAAALLNLGFFAVLVFLHMMVDAVKYREVHRYSWTQTLRATLIESLVDLMLLSLGTFAAIYLHRDAGIVATSSVLSVKAIIARAAMLYIPRVEILSHTVHIASNLRRHVRDATTKRNAMLTRGQRLSLFALLFCTLMILWAPFILPLSDQSLVQVLADQWVPWRL